MFPRKSMIDGEVENKFALCPSLPSF